VAGRTLTERELNRALLARQLLLERADLPLGQAIERLGGLQTQYAPSGYLALWTRLRGVERGDLTAALERRRVIQGTLLRATIHMVTAREYAPTAAAIRDARRTWWLRAAGGPDAERRVAAAAREVRRLLSDGPVRRADIVGTLGLDGVTWGGVGLWLDLVRVPPSGTWDRRRADLYALASDWVPAGGKATPAEGAVRLVRRYLRAFGPASRKDVAGWSGLPLATIDAALRFVRTRRFVDEHGRELLDVPGAPLPDPETPAPVRFLGTFEPILMVHARRTQILPDEHRPAIFNAKMPQSIGTFLVDGRVAGTWTLEGGRVRTSPFAPFDRATAREVREEAERLTAFMA
jgi:hypothetical protein